MGAAKRIVLTGAGRGLGLAMTEGLIAAGHVVYGCVRSTDRAAELARRWPAPHRFDVCDVTDDAAVGRWADRVLADGGPPDLLLNNAALINRNQPLWDVPADEFSDVVDVNVKGVFHVIRRFVPAMVARRAGVIVNFSSGWGRSTSAEVAPYCATKWAIEGLTRALAEELPSGMAAVPLNPGIIATDMLASCFGSQAKAYPTPAKWAKLAVPFLLALGPKDNGRPLSVPQ